MQIHMKTNKTLISTWLLGGFAFILILSSLISFLFQSNLDLPETLSHHILFTHNDLENIEKIVVKNQLGKFVLQKSTATSTKWHLIEPRSFPANPQTLKNIYDALKKISIMRILKKDAINISHYSLNKPFMELEFYDKNNRPTYVQFGIINPIDNSTYITHSGYNEIFQIKTLPYSIEGLILSDFLDARIFHTTKDEIHALTISADAIHSNDYNESVNIGCEYGFRERVFLRAGYKSLFMEESVEGLTVGVGLIYFLTDYLPMKVDYAYADFGRLQSVHRISVEIGF